MLSYFNQVIYNKITASCDSVILDGKLNFTSGDRLTNYFSHMECGVNIDYWQSFKIGYYRHQWTITFEDGISCTIQLSHNDGKKENDKIRLDYNPNKCCHNVDFVLLHNFIVGQCKYLELKRWDFALDYPVERENCFLIKDQRLYSEKSYSLSNKTQHLGIRSHDGFVKLYNKQIESKLDYPLTRLELTIDGSPSFDEINLPLVYVIDTMQMSIDDLKLVDTERFILNSLLLDMGNINMLGRKMRDKMKMLIEKYTHKLQVDFKAYYAVLHIARTQCSYLDGDILANKS